MTAEREAAEVLQVLRAHIWVGDLTHRADCDCNWKSTKEHTILKHYEHATHVADNLAAALVAAAGATREAQAWDPKVLLAELADEFDTSAKFWREPKTFDRHCEGRAEAYEEASRRLRNRSYVYTPTDKRGTDD